MTSDPLSRLRDGLARDAALAQAACDSARADTEGDASRWFVDEEPDRPSAGVTSGFPQRVVGRPGGANGVVVYDEGFPHVEQARLIAEFDPARVLRQSEKLGELVELVEELFRLDHWRSSNIAERMADTLVSIYTEDTEAGS